MEYWSWVGQVIETAFVVVLAPFAIWQLKLQVKATKDQTRATRIQNFATIISWVQAEDIRQSRGLLFDLEKKQKISTLPIDRWDEEWKQAADRVSQCLNSAAMIAQQDSRLESMWVVPARDMILRSWTIAQPRIRERRKEEGDIWKEFDWLASKVKG